MRKILFLIFLPLVGTAQISGVSDQTKVTIGQVYRGPVFYSSLSYMVDQNQDTSYVFLYRNVHYSKIDVVWQINFSGGEQTLKQLYVLMKGMFDVKNFEIPDFYRNFTLGKTNVTLKLKKNLFGTQLMVIDNTLVDTYTLLTKGEIDDLFYTLVQSGRLK